MNISIYSPLSGSTYIELPRRLRNSVEGLINIKSNDNKCFLWCNIRHLNPLKIHPEKIAKADKNMVNNLIMKALNFLSLKKILARLKKKYIFFALMCFVMKKNPVHISDKKFKDCMDLLLRTDENKSHYVYIKNFNKFMSNKTRWKNNTFADIVYNVLVVKEFW